MATSNRLLFFSVRPLKTARHFRPLSDHVEPPGPQVVSGLFGCLVNGAEVRRFTIASQSLYGEERKPRCVCLVNGAEVRLSPFAIARFMIQIQGPAAVDGAEVRLSPSNRSLYDSSLGAGRRRRGRGTAPLRAPCAAARARALECAVAMGGVLDILSIIINIIIKE